MVSKLARSPIAAAFAEMKTVVSKMKERIAAAETFLLSPTDNEFVILMGTDAAFKILETRPNGSFAFNFSGNGMDASAGGEAYLNKLVEKGTFKKYTDVRVVSRVDYLKGFVESYTAHVALLEDSIAKAEAKGE